MTPTQLLYEYHFRGILTTRDRQRPGPNNDTLRAFPAGFRMLAGDPFKRNYTGDFEAQAISFVCLDYNGPQYPQPNGLPTMACPDGVRAQVFFPSCWDGVNLDMPDHKSHMAYPIGNYNTGTCPSSHPVHMISLFYEVIYQTDNFEFYGNNPFVFAMGDPTGYGFHGDFVRPPLLHFTASGNATNPLIRLTVGTLASSKMPLRTATIPMASRRTAPTSTSLPRSSPTNVKSPTSSSKTLASPATPSPPCRAATRSSQGPATRQTSPPPAPRTRASTCRWATSRT